MPPFHSPETSPSNLRGCRGAHRRRRPPGLRTRSRACFVSNACGGPNSSTSDDAAHPEALLDGFDARMEELGTRRRGESGRHGDPARPARQVPPACAARTPPYRPLGPAPRRSWTASTREWRSSGHGDAGAARPARKGTAGQASRPGHAWPVSRRSLARPELLHIGRWVPPRGVPGQLRPANGGVRDTATPARRGDPRLGTARHGSAGTARRRGPRYPGTAPRPGHGAVRQAAQAMQVVAMGRASSRPGAIGAPHTTQTP